MTNTNETAEPSGASAGSQRPAWALVHDNERLRDEILLMRLTPAERLAAEKARSLLLSEAARVRPSDKHSARGVPYSVELMQHAAAIAQMIDRLK